MGWAVHIIMGAVGSALSQWRGRERGRKSERGRESGEATTVQVRPTRTRGKPLSSVHKARLEDTATGTLNRDGVSSG